MKNVLRFGAFLALLLVAAAFIFPDAAMAVAHAVSPEYGPALLSGLLGIGGTSALACTILPIEGFEVDECPNAGGLTDLYAIRRRDIDTFPAVDPDGVTISTAIVPKAGAGFVHWGFAADSGEVNHKSTGDLGNQSVTHEVNTYVPRGSAEIDAIVQRALNGDFVVIGRDSNGNFRIAGDKYRGVKFDFDYKSGKKGTDKNGTDFKFAGEGFTHVPFYYTAAIPLKAAAAPQGGGN
ncbi:MAG: hypothetical protein ACRYFK_16720 [Janthinobacterium lividum]